MNDTRRIQLIFRKANSVKFVGKAIAWWTAPFLYKFNGKWECGFSHCELYFPSEKKMFSASSYENRVRWRPKYNIGENWVVGETYTVDKETYSAVLAECDDLVGAKYDYAGVAGFVWSEIKQDVSKWFCSEVCSHIIKKYKLDGRLAHAVPSKLSPVSLALQVGVEIYNRCKLH